MISRIRRTGGPTKVRFTTRGRRRIVTIEGGPLAAVERQRLRQLLRALPVQSGTVTIRNDWAGRQRITFTRDIPEALHQVIRNLVGNLTRLRSV